MAIILIFENLLYLNTQVYRIMFIFEGQNKDFDFLQKILIQNNACFPRASEESKEQITSVELFEYLNVSSITLKDALIQLRSSQSFESVSKEHGIAYQKAIEIEPSITILNVQCLRTESTLSALQYLLQVLIGIEGGTENYKAAAGGVLDVMQMTRTLHEELAELATRSAVENIKKTVITKLVDALEEFQHKFTYAVYASLYFVQ